MRLTLIGYWGAYPEMNEATSCYLLEEGMTKILLDVGSGAMAKLQEYVGLAHLDAVIVSHVHHDHIADLGVLTYSRAVDIALEHTDEPLTIYAPESEMSEMAKYERKGTKIAAYRPEKALAVGPFHIEFKKTNHPVDCYAMRITSDGGDGALVYTADTAYMADFSSFAAEPHVMIAEASFFHGQNASSFGHMTSTEAGKLAREAGAEELILSHLPHFGEHQQLVDEAKTQFSGTIRLASTGDSCRL